MKEVGTLSPEVLLAGGGVPYLLCPFWALLTQLHRRVCVCVCNSKWTKEKENRGIERCRQGTQEHTTLGSSGSSGVDKMPLRKSTFPKCPYQGSRTPWG